MMITTVHDEINRLRINYLYLHDESDAKSLHNAISDLEFQCREAEQILGSGDYTIFFMPVHAYMHIKFYHDWLQKLINAPTNRFVNSEIEIPKASKTMMSLIGTAKEKHGFDFYTAMEKDESARK